MQVQELKDIKAQQFDKQYQKCKKKQYNDPQTLFCHYKYQNEQQCNKFQCPFKHQYRLFKEQDNKYAVYIKRDQNICPNGIRCPFNHKKIDCPIEKREGQCFRKTEIGKKIFKCEYRHKNTSQALQNQQFEQIKQQNKKIKNKNNKNDNNNEQEEQKQQEFQQLQIDDLQMFKIPEIENDQQVRKSSVIGIIDQSGSMEPYFEKLKQFWAKYVHKDQSCTSQNNQVITFHDDAHILKSNDYGYNWLQEFGGTNIESGFHTLHKMLLGKNNLLQNLTIIFMTDGYDSKPKTIQKRIQKLVSGARQIKQNKNIKFITVGIGKCFPTRVAIKLREIYHNSDISVPSFYIIDDPNSIDEWDFTMSKIQQQFLHKNRVQINMECIKFPWQLEPSQDIFEDEIIYLKSLLDLRELYDLAQSYLSEIQLGSIKKGQVKNFTIKSACQALEIIEKQENIINKKSFHSKLSYQDMTYNVRYREKLKVIIKQIKDLSQKSILEKLSDIQLAQRLAIGTQEGKYHLKALRYAFLTIEDFIIAKQEFLQDLQYQKQQYKEYSYNNQQQKYQVYQDSGKQQKQVLYNREGLIEKLLDFVDLGQISIKMVKNLPHDQYVRTMLLINDYIFYQNQNDENYVPKGEFLETFFKQLQNKRIQVTNDMLNSVQKHLKSDFVEKYFKKIQEKQMTQVQVDNGVTTNVEIPIYSQEEIIFDDTFIEALKLVENQYELVQMFPLVGIPVQIRRTDGSKINPFIVSLENYQNQYLYQIDTVSLQSYGFQNSNEITIINNSEDKEGVNQEKQVKINAVLPFFLDERLQFFAQSKLFSILMTFNVCQNADTSLNQSYYGLLSAAFIHALNNSNKELMNKIQKSLDIVYGPNKSFNYEIELLIKYPNLALVTEVSENLSQQIKKPFTCGNRCEDPSKAILQLFYILEYYQDNESLANVTNRTKKIQTIFCVILQECIGRFLRRDINIVNQIDISNINDFKNYDLKEDIQQIIEKYKNQFNIQNCFSHYKLKKQVKQLVKEHQINLPQIDKLYVNPKVFMNQGKLNLKSLKNIFKQLFGDEVKLSWNLIIRYSFFAYNFKDSAMRYLNKDQKLTFDVVEKRLKEGKLKQCIIEKRQQLQNEVYDILCEDFFKYQQEIHDFNNIKQQQNDIWGKYGWIRFDQNTKLPINSCISENCKFYMMNTKHLAQHLESVVKIKGLFQIVKENINKNDEIIYDVVLKKIQNEEINLKSKNQDELKIIKELNLEQYYLDNKNKFLEQIQQIKLYLQ